MQGILKAADLFSRPFSFSIGEKNKKKKTTFGGILSISILSISFVYFLYLMLLYFTNQFIPKVTKQIYTTSNATKISITESLVKFKMISYGQDLSTYETSQSKKYLTFSISHEIYAPTGNSYTYLPLKQCDKPEDSSYMCMDIDSMTEEQKSIEVDPNSLIQSNYAILIEKCSGASDCAPESEIDDLINQSNSYFVLHSNIQQYNATTMKIQSNYILEYFNLDHLLFLESTYSLKKSFTKVKSGLLIQSTNEIESVGDFQKFDRYHSYANSINSFGYSGYAYIAYKVDQSYQENTVQYAMITEILTQFTSILNILLLAGILANMVADSDIVQDFNNLLLKEYYKTTALKLVQSTMSKNPNQLEDKKHETSLYLTDRIYHLKNLIVNVNFFQQPKAFFNLSIIKRIKIIFFGVDNEKKSEEKSQEINIYNKMTDLTSKHIDILELYKDIIKLKMAIKLMLSKEQFAALQFCGRDLLPEEKSPATAPITKPAQLSKIFPDPKANNIVETSREGQQNDKFFPSNASTSRVRMFSRNQKRVSQSSDFKQIVAIEHQKCPESIPTAWQDQNHLEVIDEIENNESTLRGFLEQFLKQVDKSEDKLSLVDRNIYSSLIGKSVGCQSANLDKLSFYSDLMD